MARDSHPDWPTEQWAKQMAEMQDVLRKALGGQGFAQWAKQMAETQEALRSALGSQAVTQWAKQMAETQEAVRKALGGQGFAQWAKQMAETQEALRSALGSQAVAQWAKQMAETQEAVRKALGGQGFAQWAKQMAETQEALRSALGSQAVAQWAKQTAETQEALRKALASQAWEGTQEALRALAPVVKSYEREPRTEKPVEVSPNPEAAKPEVRMLARHADREWLNTEEARRLTLRIEQQRQQSVLVLVADIRKSTQAMMEALDPFEYASTITAFVEQSRHAVLSEGGLFDKFTGDGFLAYWPYDARTHLRARRRSLDVIKSIFISFAQETMPRLRRNSQSLPSELGLAFGIDEGLVSFVTISRDLTIVGRPVVGAVRMVGGAVAGQVIVNVHVGEEIQDDVHAGRLPGIELVPTDIPGKEYPRQMAFVVRFVDFSLPEN